MSKTSDLLQAIPISQIHPSSHQARKFFDMDGLRHLAESMRHEGLIQPITVRIAEFATRSAESDDTADLAPQAALRAPQYELISGERRLRAAQLLGWKTIACRIITVISEGEAAAKGLIENLQREDLNAIEEAEGLAELRRVDGLYWTQERIAQVAGKSQTYVSQSLSLLSLPKEIQESIRRRILSRGHALELVRLPTPSLQLDVANQIGDRLTREQTRALVNSILSRKSKEKHGKTRGPLESAGEGPDPLGDLWPRLILDLPIGRPGSTRVRYLGNFRWSIETPDLQSQITEHPATPLREQLAEWFSGVGVALRQPKAAPTRSKTPV
jgi:ParB family transcriptional regulator, chromosome partitioning protein